MVHLLHRLGVNCHKLQHKYRYMPKHMLQHKYKYMPKHKDHLLHKDHQFRLRCPWPIRTIMCYRSSWLSWWLNRAQPTNCYPTRSARLQPRYIPLRQPQPLDHLLDQG